MLPVSALDIPRVHCVDGLRARHGGGLIHDDVRDQRRRARFVFVHRCEADVRLDNWIVHTLPDLGTGLAEAGDAEVDQLVVLDLLADRLINSSCFIQIPRF